MTPADLNQYLDDGMMRWSKELFEIHFEPPALRCWPVGPRPAPPNRRDPARPAIPGYHQARFA